MERKKVELHWQPPQKLALGENDEKRRVAAYCRISRIEDDTKLSSLENQMDYYSKLIVANPDHKLIGIYYDSGISGLTIDKRPGFKRLIRHCQEGKIDLVITKSISRFSRNAKDLLEIVELLKEHNVTVFFEKEKIDSSKTRHKFFLTALAAVYQQESLTISEHVKWGFEKKNRMGEPVMLNQFGYRVVERNGVKTFRIVEEEAQVIRTIFEEFLLGKTPHQIGLMLTEEGIKSPGGKELWASASVKNVLTNSNYTGDRLTNKETSIFLEKKSMINDGHENRYLIKNTHPAIIDEVTFNKVQEIFGSRPKREKSANVKYPLSQRITCGCCGWYFHRSKRKTNSIWKCGLNSKNKNNCSLGVPFSESTLLEMMIRAMKVRYDFEKPGALKHMKDNLERVNQNDRFELHRMSHLMSLILAKEELAESDHRTYEYKMERVKELENTIVAFEDLATKIEEDRIYRVSALERLKGVENVENFMDMADIPLLRAWVMELSILTEQDFQIVWMDNDVTEIGEFKRSYDKNAMEPSNNKKQKAGIEVEHEGASKFTIPKKDESIAKTVQSKEGSEEQVEVLELRNKPPNELINKIKKKLKDESQGIIKIEPKKKMRKIRVGVYARVSTREPDQLGSLEAQVAYYTFALLKDSNNQLVRIYADEGVSGTNAEKRAGFQKMIRDCENGKVDRIITKSISRFARNTVDALDYVRKLKEHNVSIYFEKEGIDTASEDGEILLTVYSALAQEESRSLGESISWGKKAYAKRGMVGHSMRTYGYDFNKDRTWYIVEDESKVVQSIFERCIDGLSAVQICKDLTIEGIPTMKKKASWNPKTVSTILNNINYTGDLLYQKRYTQDTFTSRSKLNFGQTSQVLIEEHHPAIIDKTTWDKAQWALDKRRPKKSAKAKVYHEQLEFFSRFICSECGNFYFHVTRKTKAGIKHRWRCKVALRKDALITCDSPYIEEEEIKALFMQMLAGIKKDKIFISQLNKQIEDKKLTENEKILLKYYEEENQKVYLELYKVVEDGTKSGEDTTEIKRYTDSIMETQDMINELNDKEDAHRFLLKEKTWLFKELENIGNEEGALYRDDIFKRIIKNGVIHPDNSITFHLIFGVSRHINR